MQFTVLIEFLIPGFITLLLGLALLTENIVLPKTLSESDTAMAMTLLAVSYPIGHLVNFPVFLFLQKPLLGPNARTHTARAYRARGVDLAALVSRELGLEVSADTKEGLKDLFDYMQACAFCANIEQFNSRDLFYKSLQRLARGMLLPLLLAAFVVPLKSGVTWFSLLAALLIFFSAVLCLSLLRNFVQEEVNEIARFFVTLHSKCASGDERPTLGLKRMLGGTA